MSHFKDICECGKVVVQCRCIGPHTVRIVSPCTHAISVATHSEPVSMEILIKAKAELEQAGEMPNLLRVHPSTYNALMLYFKVLEDQRAVRESILGKQPAIVIDNPGRLLEVPILIDNELKPGEWKFERRFYD